MAEVVERLPRKHEVLSSTSSNSPPPKKLSFLSCSDPDFVDLIVLLIME
jgi:hypothetical protein